MYYFGNFRSLDQSVDPNGQEYRVVILTGWDGTSNPYPYKTMIGTLRTYRVPDVNKYVQLTLTDHPFVVNYNESYLHSPHKLSTASVSFIQDQFNTDFYDATGKKCIVALLKRNNDVVLDGNSYVNTVTGERLNHTWVNTGYMMLDIGFLPEAIDSFCYTMEWIGFTTPDVLNGEYSHIKDRFTINAQDAYSTLKYRKYEYDGDSREFSNLLRNTKQTILDFAAELGTYKRVYISNTIRFFGETDTALASLNHQQWNWFDENNEPDEAAMKPVTKLTVLDNILSFLGLKAIPWHNSLIITTPEAIAGGFNTYYTYENLVGDGNIVAYNNTQRAYEQKIDTYLPLGHDIIIDDFNGPSMQISTAEVYNSSKVVANEYPVGDLIPDFKDDHNVTEKTEIELSNNYYFKDGNTRMYWYWEHQFFWPHKENYIHGEDVDFYYYPYSYTGPGWGTSPIEDPTWFTFGAQLNRTPFAAILDDGGFQIGTDKTTAVCLSNPYEPKRVIYFNTPQGNGNRLDYGDYGNYRGGNHRFKYWQPMFHVRTKPFVAKRGCVFSIKGTWKFYDSGMVTALGCIPQQTNETANADIRDKRIAAGCGFIPMKIRVGNKYLYYSGIYRWTSTDCECQMLVELNGNSYSDIKAFNTAIGFGHTFRNFNDGFYWPIPFDDDEEVKPVDIEIWFSRPIGVADVLCECATLENFSVEVYPAEYISSRKNGNTEDTNTEYKAVYDEQVANENEEISIELSSNSIKSPRYSMVVAGDSTNGYRVVDRISNIATAHSSVPEQGLVENVMAQHKRPYIILDDNYHRGEFTPLSKLYWPTGMGEKRFIPTSFEVDYEYENVRTIIQEIGINVDTPSVHTCNLVRNMHRRGDLINSDAVLWREPAVLQASRDIIIDNFTATFSQRNEHWRVSSDTPEVSSIQFQPVFEDGRMVVSIPDEIDGDVKLQIDGDGHLKVTNNGTFPGGGGDIPPIDPDIPIPYPVDPVDPVTPVAPEIPVD